MPVDGAKRLCDGVHGHASVLVHVVVGLRVGKVGEGADVLVLVGVAVGGNHEAVLHRVAVAWAEQLGCENDGGDGLQTFSLYLLMLCHFENMVLLYTSNSLSLRISDRINFVFSSASSILFSSSSFKFKYIA